MVALATVSLSLVGGLLVLLWLVSLRLKDSSVIDIFWGAGFAVIAAVGLFLGEGYEARRLLLAVLVAIWGLRLSLYILWRNWGKGEDYRYQAWRQEAGAAWWWRSFFKVFLLQGVIMGLLAAPLWLIQSSPAPASLGLFDLLAAAIWLTGLGFESLGDWQLARFKADPRNKGRVMDRGLWRYTRHPNYFGDAVVWWGYGMMALGISGGWWTLFAPVLMTLLLVRVSGVALLERTLTKSKPGYEEYVRNTSAFFPWPPRRSA